MMVILFSTGEYRLFDATTLFKYPAFELLENEDVFKSAKIEYGVVTWNDGDIDIAPEKMYQDSYVYEPLTVQRDISKKNVQEGCRKTAFLYGKITVS